jgi:predicted nucleic acid-binding protein
MVFFDTSVLVTALVTELPNHERALDCLVKYSRKKGDSCTTNHVLAEAYASLTALPVKKRISPMDARSIIEESLVKKLQILQIDTQTYLSAIRRVSNKGMTSGIIYDALHLETAESSGCTELLTYNLKDFRRLDPRSILVVSP